MTRLYNNCRKGAGGAPDIGVGGQYAYEAYEMGQGALRRYPTNEKVTEVQLDEATAKKWVGGTGIHTVEEKNISITNLHTLLSRRK